MNGATPQIMFINIAFGAPGLDLVGHQQLVEHLLREIGVGRGERHFHRLAVLLLNGAILVGLVKSAGDRRQQRGLAAEIDGGVGNLVRLKLVEKFRLRQRRATGVVIMIFHHEQRHGRRDDARPREQREHGNFVKAVARRLFLAAAVFQIGIVV